MNLPAHLVVVKGTMHYVMGGYVEYSESQILQMIGRAGRPQVNWILVLYCLHDFLVTNLSTVIYEISIQEWTN